MSIRPVVLPEVPEQTVAVARAAFPRGSLAIRVRDRLAEVCCDKPFAKAFGVRGAPGLSPGVLSLVTVLQYCEDLTDRQAATKAVQAIDWKYALGMELVDTGFDASVLSNFRSRLAEHGTERVVFDRLLEHCGSEGLVKAGGKQRTDSTHVISAVRDLNRTELAVESVRATLEAVAVAAPSWPVGVIDVAGFAERYGPRVDSWTMPRSKSERERLARVYHQDALTLCRATWADDAPKWMREIEAVTLLRQVLAQTRTVRTDPRGRGVVEQRDADDEGVPPGTRLVEKQVEKEVEKEKEGRSEVLNGGSSVLHEMLVKLRQRRGWTQVELSERSGVSVRTIRNLETGKVSKPRRASLRLLSSALDPEGGPEILANQPIRGESTAHWHGAKSPQNPLVGRDEDLGFLAEAIRQRRLVVLVGPGGVGKSRLALALAESAAAGLVDDVSVINLGSVPAEGMEPQQSFERISAAVKKERPHRARPRSHLIVLDNAEHVATTVTKLSQRLLADHPEVRLVITSRLRLAVDAACTWEVTPLDTESSDGPGELPPAVELVMQRMSSSCPSLADAMAQAHVQRLCRLLDGIPRSLEIAVERLRSVSLDDLLALLENDARPEVLKSVDCSLLPHQRDIVGSVEWSLGLLDPTLRSFLSRLACLDGEFSLQDIESLPSAHPPAPFPRKDIVHMLAQLADHSLVRVVRGDVYRYRLMSCVRSVVLSASERGMSVEETMLFQARAVSTAMRVPAASSKHRRGRLRAASRHGSSKNPR